jgi:PAS domain S-box-containing protein
MAEAARTQAQPVARVARSSRSLLVVDDDGVCLEASLGACRELGLARSKVVGTPIAQLLDADSRERFAHVWQAFREGGGKAEPFAFAAAGEPIAISVTPEIVPGRHLLGFESTGRIAGDLDAEVDRAIEPRQAAAPERQRGRGPSARERQVLGMLASGATDVQIAAQLELSPATVQTHVRNAKAKLGARTRAQAVAMALRQGLIGSP